MIPKVIHYCWFGGKELPEEFKEYIDGWKRLCPDYEIIRWDETNYDVTKNRYMREAYECKQWGFVPDYARLDIVYSYGGIYLDTDIELLKSFDELLDLDGFCGVEKSSKYVALGLGFGAKKGNKIIRLIRDEYEKMTFLKANGTMDTLPSPEINTRPLYKLGYRYGNRISTLSSGGDTLTVFPSEYFCPVSYETGLTQITEHTVSIHHYSGSWQSKDSKEIKALGQKYSQKYGEVFGKKIAKLIYYRRKKGLTGILVLIMNAIRHRIIRLYRRI